MKKILFVEARRNIDYKKIEELKKEIKKIPFKKIGLIASIQHINILLSIKKLLEAQDKEIFIAKDRTTNYPGQILGCDVGAAIRIEKKINAFLFVGTGKFHIFSLALKTKKPIFILNPETSQILRFSDQEIFQLKKKGEAAIRKFLMTEQIGILVSTKPGQYKLDQALKLKKRLAKKGKQASLFICDTLNKEELENFPCKSFVNTACPGIAFDDPRIVNFNEIISFI